MAPSVVRAKRVVGGHVVTVSLSPDGPETLPGVLTALESSDGVRAVVLAGGAADAFRIDADLGAEAGRLAALPAPVVVALEGACVGGGIELALAADLRIAADTATFAVATPAGGVLPVGARLTRLVGEARAKDLALTGRPVGAPDARRLGLVSRVVPAAALRDEAAATADLIAARAPLAVRAVREAVRRRADQTHAEALRLEHDLFCRLSTTDDHREAVAAFFAKRPAVFAGR